MKKLPCLLLAICLLGGSIAACNPPTSEGRVEPTDSTLTESVPPTSEETPPVAPSDPVTPPTSEETPPVAPSDPVTPPTSEEPPPVAPSDPVAPPTNEPPSTPVTPPAKPTAQYIRCTGDSVNLRAGAGKDFAIIGNTKKGTMYAVTGKIGDWYKTYYRGKTAYISAAYASVFTLEKTENKAEDVIKEGYKLLGTPYVYGAVRLHDGKGKLLAGFSAQKFDCSSLIQYIFYKGTGTLLGLTTRNQVKQGKLVKRADLQRGDCIFFTNEERQYKTGIERIGHVALYLGDGYILHTSSDFARIEKMSAKRWSFYVEARRFF